MTELDHSLIGTYTPPFDVEVERGAIRKFARAIGETNPLYFDCAHARRHGYDDVVAPPTFPTCFRPPHDPAWMVALDRRRIMAGEMSFSYERPIVAGMRLTCRLYFSGVDVKQGARGVMELIRQALQGRDEAGELVFVVDRTTVYRSQEQIEKRSLA